MMIFGAAVLALGILWLLSNLGIIPGSVWTYFWPILLIIIGLAIIMGRRRMRHRWWNRFPPDDSKKP